MNELQVKGTQEFLGKTIKVIEGGFGENQKVILAKTIAEIHETDLKRVNELINRNIDEFEEGVDLLDLKTTVAENDRSIFEELGFNNRDISISKNVYLLSEQGYMLLVGFMDTEKAKEIRKQLRREYFAMREVINSNEQLKANLLLSIYNGGQEGILASKQLTEMEIKEATTPLLAKIEEDKPLVDYAETIIQSSDSIDIGTFAKVVKDENIPLGRNKLFDWLRINKILMKNNVPYQRYIDNKYFEVIEYTYNTPYGEKIGFKTLITGVGQVKIVEKLKKEYNVN